MLKKFECESENTEYLRETEYPIIIYRTSQRDWSEVQRGTKASDRLLNLSKDR